MSAITMRSSRFDVVEYIKKLRNVGVSQEVAEVQGQELEHVIGDVLEQTKQEAIEIFNNKDIATKGDVFAVKDDVLAVKDDVLAVKNDVFAVKDDVLAVKDDVLAVKNDVFAVKDDVLALKDDVLALKDDVTTVKNDISLVRGEIRESELRLQKEIEILRGEVKTDLKSLEIKLLVIYAGGFLILLSVLAKGFHWL